MCEILIDRQFFAHFVRIQVTELMDGGQPWRWGCVKIWIQKKIWPVSDLDQGPGFGSGFESGSEIGSGSETNFRPDPDPKLDQNLLFRIRNTAQNVPDPGHCGIASCTCWWQRWADSRDFWRCVRCRDKYGRPHTGRSPPEPVPSGPSCTPRRCAPSYIKNQKLFFIPDLNLFFSHGVSSS